MNVQNPGDTMEGPLLLDGVVNLIELVRHDLNEVLRAVPNAPLFTVVDLVTALGHLRKASVLADKVADTLTTEGV